MLERCGSYSHRCVVSHVLHAFVMTDVSACLSMLLIPISVSRHGDRDSGTAIVTVIALQHNSAGPCAEAD